MADEKFDLGIKNAVRVCMNVNADDRVFIISDQDTSKISGSLETEVLAIGAPCFVAILEDYGSRPMTTIPEKLLGDLLDFKPAVTFYTAESQEGEVKMRLALTREIRRIFTEENLPLPRHGHMVSITPQLIREGMTADYIEINRTTMKILERVKDAREITVTSAEGSDISAKFDPDYNWVPCHGLYHSPGDWGNLPEGEVFTCPVTLDGVLIVNVIGDYFSPKYGVLGTPLTIKVKDGWVTEVSSKNQALAQEFLDYLDSAKNGRRAGEFAIGTNTAVTKLTGNLLQDEKIPGIHVAFGNPSRYNTGADWTSEVHVDVIPIDCTITVDGEKIMEDGKFLI